MPGRNKWPWVLAGSPWLTIRHVTPAEATNSSPDTKQEARCEILPPQPSLTAILYSQHTRLVAVLGTHHYNCVVCLCLLNAPHVDLYIECWRALTFFIKHELLCKNVKSTGQLLSQTAHTTAISRGPHTSLLEHKASASHALVPLMKLMMCVGQISFCVSKPYRQSSVSRLYDVLNRSHHNIFSHCILCDVGLLVGKQWDCEMMSILMLVKPDLENMMNWHSEPILFCDISFSET